MNDNEIDNLADALNAAVADYDQGVADGNIDANDDVCISLQKYEDGGSAWWSVEISDCFATDMTDFKSGSFAFDDIEEIRAGNASDIADDYRAAWDEDWTDSEAA